MAKISQLVISRGVTVNQGNYESERYDVSLTVTLDKGDDPAIIAAEFQEETDRLVALALLRRLSAGGSNSISGKIARSSIDTETKVRQIQRYPEFPWIEKLYPVYAADLLNYIREGVKPIQPAPTDYFGSRLDGMGLGNKSAPIADQMDMIQDDSEINLIQGLDDEAEGIARSRKSKSLKTKSVYNDPAMRPEDV